MKISSRVIIKGHQRAGNNYLIHLIGMNFFDGLHNPDSFSDGNDHCILNKLQYEAKYLYIYRNKIDTLKSVFNERFLYGLTVNYFEEFVDKKYIDMYDPLGRSDQRYVTLKEDKNHKNLRNIFFCCIDKSPSEWYEYHLSKYKMIAESNSNLFMVSYDELISNFIAEMDKISVFLTGQARHDYQNIGIRVGWFPK